MTVQEFTQILQTFTLHQLKKICCVVYYDTNFMDLDEETKNSIIELLTKFVNEDDPDESGHLYEEDGELYILVREGKSGDSMKVEDLLSSMHTGENWRDCTFENSVGLN